jgi:HTH-type transcriptional repressor of NAD biosynthesis genes
VQWVPEVLRDWCDTHRRTPGQDEQYAIALEQSRQVATWSDVDICISDTSPLLTAIYSEMLFADSSFTSWALQEQSRFHLTLLTDLDIAWEADGLQRDGPHVRDEVDAALRSALAAQQLPFQVISGVGPRRTQAALQAVLEAFSVRGATAG